MPYSPVDGELSTHSTIILCRGLVFACWFSLLAISETMQDGYIDTANTQHRYAKALLYFQADKSISQRNKELLLAFLRDCALGKMGVRGRARKRLSPSSRLCYLRYLHPLMTYLGKDLDEVTQQDMEEFIEALETDQIRTRPVFIQGHPVVAGGEVLSDRYKVDIKAGVRRFYKWLLGDNKDFPKLVEWIDTYAEAQEVPSLTETEVEALVDRARNPLERALVQVLFDGGLRLGELLNIRLKHVELKCYKPTDPSERCFVVRVPFSKTLRRTVPLPMMATQKYLTIWLEEHPAKPAILPDGTTSAENVEVQLFPLTQSRAQGIVRRLGRRALGKRVYPHLLRHTSATYWSNKLPYFKFCKRFGWTMTSDMPRRYIDRAGVDDMEVAEIYHRSQRQKFARKSVN